MVHPRLHPTQHQSSPPLRLSRTAPRLAASRPELLSGVNPATGQPDPCGGADRVCPGGRLGRLRCAARRAGHVGAFARERNRGGRSRYRVPRPRLRPVLRRSVSPPPDRVLQRVPACPPWPHASSVSACSGGSKGSWHSPQITGAVLDLLGGHVQLAGRLARALDGHAAAALLLRPRPRRPLPRLGRPRRCRQ